MLNNINISKLVGTFIIIIVISLILLIVKTLFLNNIDTNIYLTYTKPNVDLKLNGDYVIYLNIGDKYKEKGATTKASKKINISYYKNNRRVIMIDTNELATYTVKYSINIENKQRTITRTVIICDNKKPLIAFPETTTITTNEVKTYTPASDVIASDNSGKVKLTYNGALKQKSDNYIITYKATDASGNQTSKKRLIKVKEGIAFKTIDNKITINYPVEENYKYYYSVDSGNTFKETTNVTTLNSEDTNVIAVIYKDNTYITSNTYTKRKAN